MGYLCLFIICICMLTNTDITGHLKSESQVAEKYDSALLSHLGLCIFASHCQCLTRQILRSGSGDWCLPTIMPILPQGKLWEDSRVDGQGEKEGCPWRWGQEQVCWLAGRLPCLPSYVFHRLYYWGLNKGLVYKHVYVIDVYYWFRPWILLSKGRKIADLSWCIWLGSFKHLNGNNACLFWLFTDFSL